MLSPYTDLPDAVQHICLWTATLPVTRGDIVGVGRNEAPSPRIDHESASS